MAKKLPTRIDLEDNSIDAIRAKMCKKYGENTIVSAAKAAGMLIRHISTGVTALDLALGGGIPENRIIEFRGGFSSLKTTIALCLIKNFLALYKNGLAVFVDAEHTFDPSYLIKLGIPQDRVEVANPDSGEQACDICVDYLSIKGRPVLVILDSIAALVPMAEVEGSHEQQTMGVQARLVNKLMRVANARLKRSAYDLKAPKATLVCLNQLREKIGVMFGNPETTPGGKGKDFYFSTVLRVNSTPSGAIKEEVEQHGIKRQIRFGQNVKFQVLKNKTGGSQFEEGEFEYYVKPYKGHPAYSFNNDDHLFRAAVFYGVITASSKGYAYNGFVAKSESDYIARLVKSEKGTFEEVYAATLEAIAQAENVETDTLEATEKFDAAEDDVAEEIIEVVKPKRGVAIVDKKKFKKFSFSK